MLISTIGSSILDRQGREDVKLLNLSVRNDRVILSATAVAHGGRRRNGFGVVMGMYILEKVVRCEGLK